ncbi:Adenosylcobinamide-GDP ribazoletransferase [Sinobacterium norvegicum]|uniref:Adenosylcobinamide-GDP ribazoletransferase n=1 Tax=Sinobacterium norvegicum TaxID=1641715 RepID=A0ABM9AFV0_9GAMM|nr:adenosylcobinamide-GDP ribazoletransferase [Sinobacterium norvegicum]CAH0991989.1 Adenosylcobinamide-GDP ribazoletransferase [Sinobacterium norvegicum]
MGKISNQIFVAVAFLTRLPVPENIDYSDDIQRRSQRFYPLVGLILALISLLFYFLFATFLPVKSAVLLLLVTTMLATGGLHEDGFADCCDGFGGGYGDKEKILNIMKDSRLGTFGVAGLVFLVLLKWQLLVIIALHSPLFLCLAVVFCYSASRWQPLLVMSKMQYVQHRGSKTEQLENKLSGKELSLSAVVSLLTAVLMILCGAAGLLPAMVVMLIVVLTVFLFSQYFCRFLQRRLEGYTGDCLGAGQQITEIIIYLCLAAAVSQHWL